ncbi:protoporphyrinogen oxidase [Saccharomonospora viridis DSM 43017]|uniref:Coproporphyrinogen III oxidase n=1 Tax=Saccharomonospora viridis (strain ATCC 15386 / DSM 43017 / JCM 3036 / CCUG 5913 / NBRC 12207 / NCIMB 9602 / P101) TaxID=471857 RepID=C7MYI6_SACVD|nr:protoporphyrinogen oxidase [Saccharomonospora viridis DSM 43017]
MKGNAEDGRRRGARPSRVVVVGAGIAGLAAAWRLRAELGAEAQITVCDAASVPGGKVRTVEVAGRRFDVGAEAVLARRPEAVTLIREVGLGDDLVHPTSASSAIRALGRTVPMPKGTMMGIPASAEAVADVLSQDGVEAVAAEAGGPPLSLPDHDVSLGGLLRSRFGDEVVDRLVDPLLGGVYAGGADGLGLRATLPAVAAAVDAGATSLTEAVARTLPERPSSAPVFATLRGGLGDLVDRLVESGAVELRLGQPVRELVRRPSGGWRLRTGAAALSHAPADAELDADAVVLAVPPPAASRLLATVAPDAASAYAEMELASMAVVALALPPGTELPPSSGILIGERERRADGTRFTAKAFTFSARKWEHHNRPGEPVLIRGSVGRFGEVSTLQASDDELVERVRRDLAELTGITASPVDTYVMRWGGGLPQYSVGHLDRVARIERAVAGLDGLAVAGAALHGVGLPACVATGDAAARRVVGQ